MRSDVRTLVRLLVACAMFWARAADVAGADGRIVDAAKTGDIQALRVLIAERADVNTPAADGTTALHWAAHRGDVEALGLLLSARGDVNARNRYGATPLMVACVNDRLPVVERLLAAGADVNAAMNEGDTPLMTAARTGDVRIVEALLRHGAAVEATEHASGQTALMWAASEDHAEAAGALIRAGAVVATRSTGDEAFTALLFAARSGSLRAAQVLLDAGANVDDTLSSGMSALVLAIANARYDMAALLLEHGADPNAATQGWTALHQLAWTRNPNTNINFPVSVSHEGLDSLSVMRTLLEHGADPDLRVTKEPDHVYIGRYGSNHIGGTAFFLASFLLDVPMMRVLLDAGADPLLGNVENTTPLMAAAGVGFFVEGEHPFTADQALAAVTLCLEAGGDPTGADLNGDTPLHGAAFRGVNAVVTLLVEKGARLDAKNHPVVNTSAPRGDNAQQRGLLDQAARDGGWTPWRIASGVSDIFGLRQKLGTAALLRRLMEERGLWTEELARQEGQAR